MAVRDIGSIRVEDAATGSRAQTIEGAEQASGNPTFLQSVVLVDRRINSGSPAISRYGLVSDDSTFELNSSPPHTPIDCGDKRLLIVQAITADSLYITPIGYNAAGDAVTVLFEQKTPQIVNGTFKRSGKEEVLMEAVTWDLLGVEKVAIAVTGIGKGADIMAWLI